MVNFYPQWWKRNCWTPAITHLHTPCIHWSTKHAWDVSRMRAVAVIPLLNGSSSDPNVIQCALLPIDLIKVPKVYNGVSCRMKSPMMTTAIYFSLLQEYWMWVCTHFTHTCTKYSHFINTSELSPSLMTNAHGQQLTRVLHMVTVVYAVPHKLLCTHHHNWTIKYLLMPFSNK